MKSRSRHHRSKWAHCNTPEAKRRRRAEADARREAICATLPPAYAGPEPLSRWQSVVVLESWALSRQGDVLPDYLHDQLTESVELLATRILGGGTMSELELLTREV